MTLTILYFARLRDEAKRTEELLTVDSPCDVGALLTLLKTLTPNLTLDGVRAAVNEEFVKETHALNEGDTVALIPPVSGG